MIERFTNEINLIHNSKVKSLVLKCLEYAPKYFWTIPSSSTGEYHPKDEFCEGGKVLHTKKAVKIGSYLCECLSITGLEKDCVLAALIMHDLCFPKGTTITSRDIFKRRKNNRWRQNKIEKEEQINVIQKKIENIKIGDDVLSWNGKEKVWDKVTKIFRRTFNDFIILRFSNGNEIRCTINHPFAVIKKGEIRWIEAKDINVNDELVQYKYNSLGLRLFNLSKRNMSLEEFYGKDRAAKIKDKHSKANIIIFNSSEMKRKRSEQLKERWQNPILAKKLIDAAKATHTEEYREKRSEIAKNLWKNLEYIKKQKDSIVGRELMTKSVEKKISYIVRNICPGEYKYCGNTRAGISIDGFIPDFINIRGKKKIIEGYGCYWHACKKCGHENIILFDGTTANEIIRRDYRRLSALKSKGYDILVIWEHELQDDHNNVKDRIMNFNYNPNVEVIKVKEKLFEHKENGEEVYNIETEKHHNYFAYGILVHNCSNGYPENSGHTVDGHGYLWSVLARDIFTKNDFLDSDLYRTISRLIMYHMGKYDLPYILDWSDKLATCVHVADFIASRRDIIIPIESRSDVNILTGELNNIIDKSEVKNG